MKKGLLLISLVAVLVGALAVLHVVKQHTNAQTASISAPESISVTTAPNTTSTDLVMQATLPPSLGSDSPAGQVIQMMQSGVDTNTILAYINNSTVLFDLSPDQINYLNDLGMPKEIVTAMTQHDMRLGVTIDAPPPDETQEAMPDDSGQASDDSQQPQQVTENDFYTTLGPYGNWVNIPGYGTCWQPCAGAYNAAWTPYGTRGHWVYTDSGWYWVSGYSWGWCTFHYGRWLHNDQRGWCWWPDTTWGPSWVVWRSSGNYCGWAPLPPNSLYRQGAGFVFNGKAVSAGFDFGIDANRFTFVPIRNVLDPHPERSRLDKAKLSGVFKRTKVYNNLDFKNGAIVNNGFPIGQIVAVTGKPVVPYKIKATTRIPVTGKRGEQVAAASQTLVIKRPVFDANAVASLNRGIKPAPRAKQPAVHQPASLIVYGNVNNQTVHISQDKVRVKPFKQDPAVATAVPQYGHAAHTANTQPPQPQSHWSPLAPSRTPPANNQPVNQRELPPAWQTVQSTPARQIVLLGNNAPLEQPHPTAASSRPAPPTHDQPPAHNQPSKHDQPPAHDQPPPAPSEQTRDQSGQDQRR